MYEMIVKWIGWNTCQVAGDLGDMLQAGKACVSDQALSMGFIVIGIAAVAVVVMIINERRRKHRETFYRH